MGSYWGPSLGMSSSARCGRYGGGGTSIKREVEDELDPDGIGFEMETTPELSWVGRNTDQNLISGCIGSLWDPLQWGAPSTRCGQMSGTKCVTFCDVKM